MKKTTFIQASILLFFAFMISSCKKEEKNCDNNLDYNTYADCKCPEGFIQFPNSQICQNFADAAGRFMVTNTPEGFFGDNKNQIYFDIGGTNFLPSPWGQSENVLVGLMENSYTISQKINTEAISYYINETKDSFVLDLRKLPDNLGFNSNVEGIFLNGTLNGSTPNADWKWNVTSDDSSFIPLRTHPASVIN